jgi:hypothetical protein
MKIHSDILSPADFYTAIEDGSGVWVDELAERGSHSRKRAFEVRLAADPKPGRRRKRNTGQYGADSLTAATYDEHGFWMAELFRIDPDAIIAFYDGVDDFNRQTEGKFA